MNLEVDFFEDVINYLDNKEKGIQATQTPEKIKVIDTSLKEPEGPYKIDDDNNTITIQGACYSIPSYFNKEMIKVRDKKTIDMILIALGRIDLTNVEEEIKQRKLFM